MVAFIVLLGIIFGGVKLLAIANNISDSEAMDKYSGKLFVVGIIVFIILMCVIGNIIFKGSIGDFIKEYNKYYENIDVIINDKGKVVLE